MVIVSGLYAETSEEITWYQGAFPPAVIHDSTENRKGWINLMLDDIIRLTSDYTHNIVDAKMSRFYNEAKKQSNACHAFLFKTPEREQFLVYSKPNYVILPNGVIIKKGQKHKFQEFIDDSGFLNLSRLIKNENYKIGLGYHLAYGASIDPILEPYREYPHVYTIKVTDYIASLLNMLNAGRVDYIMAYAAQVKYWSIKLGFEDRFVYLPLKENHNGKLSMFYIACSMTDTCKKFIEDVNLKIQTKDHINKVTNYYSEWLDPNARHELKRLKKIFIEQKL